MLELRLLAAVCAADSIDEKKLELVWPNVASVPSGGGVSAVTLDESLLGPIVAEADELRLCWFTLLAIGDPVATEKVGSFHVVALFSREAVSGSGCTGLGGVLTIAGALRLLLRYVGDRGGTTS
jgi:hypothetical protein